MPRVIYSEHGHVIDMIQLRMIGQEIQSVRTRLKSVKMEVSLYTKEVMRKLQEE